jgi:ornithine cyclodeaminase/alanine dehydrogenase-like protein (mu-crystallin family)
MSTLLLNRNTIKNLIEMSDVINVVEETFRMRGEGRGKMPSKTYLRLEHGDFRAMPTALPGFKDVKRLRRTPQNSILWTTFNSGRDWNR